MSTLTSHFVFFFTVLFHFIVCVNCVFLARDLLFPYKKRMQFAFQYLPLCWKQFCDLPKSKVSFLKVQCLGNLPEIVQLGPTKGGKLMRHLCNSLCFCFSNPSFFHCLFSFLFCSIQFTDCGGNTDLPSARAVMLSAKV